MKKIILLLVVLHAGVLCVVAQSTKTKNVVIITLDGFRWQELFTGADSALVSNKDYTKDPLGLKAAFWAETEQERRSKLMPFFWSTIAKQGQLYGNRLLGSKVNCSNQMWFSYPGYNEILCGIADDARIKSNNKIANPNISVLEFLNSLPAYNGKVAGFGSWDVFPFILNTERSKLPVNAGIQSASGSKLSAREIFLNELQPDIPVLWDGMRMDAFTHGYALEYMKKSQPRVLFISYGETDDFAHAGRYDNYLRSAKKTDEMIGELWTWVQSNSFYKDKTTFIITTDHGRGTIPLDTWRSHGIEIAGADQIWFAVIGPDTPAMGEVKESSQYYQKQVARTAAAFLGVDFTGTAQTGEVVAPMIKGK